MFFINKYLIPILLLQCSVIYCKISPDYIVPCVGLKSECLKKTIQEVIPHFVKGIPNIGVNSTDPYYSKNIDLEFPGGLKLQFSEGVFTGLRKCIVEDASYQNREANVEFRCNITAKGKYKALGQILIISIRGDGDAKIKVTDFILKGKLKFTDAVRDGITYSEIKKYDVSYEVKDKVQFALTNLFDGNSELSETVLKFMNENWREVVDEFGGPIFKEVVSSAIENIRNFFGNIPKDELFIV
ncbi:circadian clock-controlled protein daywake-like [Battus philenor]|uniref:circadian clock-controlled protein daywake-like n=1 Tax=Battus philenor TaxID=42288 RepID=UPI0035CF628B